MGPELWMIVPLAGIAAFFGTICYGLTILGRAISGRGYRKEVEVLRAEVEQMRHELSSTVLNQDDEIQRLGERLRTTEQALTALRAAAPADNPTAHVGLQGPRP
jgi:hypothetical protein